MPGLLEPCMNHTAGNSNSREEGTIAAPSTAPSVNLAIDTEMEMPDAADRGLVGSQDASGASGAFTPAVGGNGTGLEDIYATDIYAANPHVRLGYFQQRMLQYPTCRCAVTSEASVLGTILLFLSA